MKILVNVRSYTEGYVEVTAAELEVLNRVLSRMVAVENHQLYGDEPYVKLLKKHTAYSIDVVPDHVMPTLPATAEE